MTARTVSVGQCSPAQRLDQALAQLRNLSNSSGTFYAIAHCYAALAKILLVLRSYAKSIGNALH